MAMPSRPNMDSNQPMLGGFEVVPGVDVPHETPELSAIQPVATGRTEAPYLDDFERPYDELGGGTKEHGMVDPPRFPQPHHPPRRIGHVRYVEGSDSGHDPYWNAQGEPTAEQAAANTVMVQTLRRQLAGKRAARLLADGESPSQVAAMLRAREDKRQRQK